MSKTELLKVFWPLILSQIVLAAWAVIDISKRKKTKILPRPAWIILSIVFANIGPIAYFLLGREER